MDHGRKNIEEIRTAKQRRRLRSVITESLGNRAFWNAYRHMELPDAGTLPALISQEA